MQKKYGVSGAAPLLFAVGDGNHSLATAKACYEEQKKGKAPEEYLALPARYALVEVVNNHDDALQFEPIHRVLFGVEPRASSWTRFRPPIPTPMRARASGHTIEFALQRRQAGFITVPDPEGAAGRGHPPGASSTSTSRSNGGEVDYIHGDDVTR